ncbi:MAG: UDP-3-O-(3-hydroxymyristoyl)glucosamine N-acyltransferase [Planctomycetota bacterium]|nr:MAG: UDP-3-O-(3-hydroxymyristoyl)glucosamine N-acyltransferase [Planctomycetota bacterium]
MSEPAAPALTAAEVAEFCGGRLEGPADRLVRRLDDLATAGPDAAAFLAPGRPLPADCRSGLLLAAEEADTNSHPCVVRVADPALAAARLAARLHPRSAPAAGVHPSAVVAADAEVAVAAHVGPGCVVGSGAVIGAGAVLLGRVTVGERARVGEGTWLHPGVVLYPGVEIGRECTIHANTVIGSDGFGYVQDGGEHVKVPQLGTVRIGDRVEIGACCAIDRGTFGATEIGDGSILDNLVQVGHNCRLGRAVVLCGQVGLAGSTVVEDGALLAGQAGAGGHLVIGAGAQVAGRAAVTSDVPPGARVGGHPAWDLALEMRARAALRRLARRSR